MTVSVLPMLPTVPGTPPAGGDAAGAGADGSAGAFAGLLGDPAAEAAVPGEVPAVAAATVAVATTPGTDLASVLPGAIRGFPLAAPKGEATTPVEDVEPTVATPAGPVLTAAQIIAAAQVVPVAPLLAAAAAVSAAARTGGAVDGVDGTTTQQGPVVEGPVEGPVEDAVAGAGVQGAAVEGVVAEGAAPALPAGTTDPAAAVVPTSEPIAAGTAPAATETTDAPVEALAGLTTVATDDAPVVRQEAAQTPVSGTTSATGAAFGVQLTGATTAAAGSDAAGQSSQVTGQVFPEVSRLVSRGDGTRRITLKLSPEALGDVRVVLTVRGGEVHVRMAGGELAQQALLQGAPELHKLLESVGATASRLEIGDSRSTFDGGRQDRASDLAQEQGTTDHQTARKRDGENPMATDGATGGVRTRSHGSTEPATRTRPGVDVTM